MADSREEKLKAARDKLEKFRKKKGGTQTQEQQYMPQEPSAPPSVSDASEAGGLASYFGNSATEAAASSLDLGIPGQNFAAPLASFHIGGESSSHELSQQQQLQGLAVGGYLAGSDHHHHPTPTVGGVPGYPQPGVGQYSSSVGPALPAGGGGGGGYYGEAAEVAADIQVPVAAPSQPAADWQSVGGSQHSSNSPYQPAADQQHSSISSSLLPAQQSFSAEKSGEVAELELQLRRESEEKEQVYAECERLRSELASERAANSANDSQEKIRALEQELKTKSHTIQLLVSEKTELESKSSYLEQHCQLLLGEKKIMTQEAETLKALNQELKAEVTGRKSESLQLVDMSKEIAKLTSALDTASVDNTELQSKLSKMSEEQRQDKSQIKQLTSELEITKVQLIQLRGSSGLGAGNTGSAPSPSQQQEIQNLSQELQATRKSLAEALGARDRLAADREKLAEQYRNYSRDLAVQAERLSEQLRRYQEENARLVHRETGLVSQIEGMEKQMQKYVQGGKNVTEEEISRLKERCGGLETDLRQARDAREKLQQMYCERSSQVEEMMKRITAKDTRILELNAALSSLETTVEMLKSDSGTAGSEFLAAMESDKVAASRAMQQNTSLKHHLEELQKEIINLNNSKAEVLDKLEDAKRTIERLGRSQEEIAGLQAALRERDMTLTNLRNQVKYLELQLSSSTAAAAANMEQSTAKQDQCGEPGLGEELAAAKDQIRSLNSINSELRSQIEVLSSRTTECSEERDSRSPSSNRTRNSSSDGEDSPPSPENSLLESTISLSSNSFVEVDSQSKAKTFSATSSDSFVDLQHEKEQHQLSGDQLTEAVSRQDNGSQRGPEVMPPREPEVMPPRGPEVMSRQLPLEPVTPGSIQIEPWKQLQSRFISAMDKIATLSSDKEQLEHLVTRLQEETETVHDYIIMYQHQRQQQKLRLKEKDEQLQQLSRDRANLQAKIADLSSLVNRIVTKENGKEVNQEAGETGETGEGGDVEAASNHSHTGEREKICQLLSEIESQSDNIVSSVEGFEPWFFAMGEANHGKIITV